MFNSDIYAFLILIKIFFIKDAYISELNINFKTKYIKIIV